VSSCLLPLSCGGTTFCLSISLFLLTLPHSTCVLKVGEVFDPAGVASMTLRDNVRYDISGLLGIDDFKRVKPPVFSVSQHEGLFMHDSPLDHRVRTRHQRSVHTLHTRRTPSHPRA
jgi:hypothetical protein